MKGFGTVMDIFCECIVKHKKSIIDYLIVAATAAGALFLSFILFLISHLTFGLSPILIFLLCYGAYLIARTRFVEYEYILTNNELDIDKIAAKSKRKHMLTVDFKHIEVCAAVDDENYGDFYNNTQGIMKKYDFSGMENNLYFADFITDSGKYRILFSPSETLLENLTKINSRNVHIS